MEYMGTKEAAEKWGYSESTVCKWCRDDKIQVLVKPEKVSGRWRIPINSKCPKPMKNSKKKM